MTNLAIKEREVRKTETESALGDALKAIKQQPLDIEIATVFIEMRESSGQSLEVLSQQLGTNIGLLEDLEKGDLSGLPSWEVCSPIITNYTKMLGIDSKPILRRIALNIQARQKAKNLKQESVSPIDSMNADTVIGEPVIEDNTALELSSLDKRQDALGFEEPKHIKEETQLAGLNAQNRSEKELGKVAPNTNNNAQNADVSLAAATIIPARQADEVKYRPISGASSDDAKNAGLKPISKLASLPLKTEQNTSSFEHTETKILTPLKADLRNDQPSLSIPQELKVPFDEPHVQQVKSQLQRYDQPLFDAEFANEPDVMGKGKPPVSKEAQNATLRADKRDFSHSSDTLLAPPMADLLQPERKGLGLFSKVLIVFVALALVYIAWFLYSEPKLGKMLLDQLPFISKTAV